MTPLDTREWLESVYATGGPDADRAREALELIDAAQDDADELQLWHQLDVEDVRDARLRLKHEEAIGVWAEQDPTFREFVTNEKDLTETLRQFARMFDEYEKFRRDVQDLAIEAGLLNGYDGATDPLPLIRMFLPV